MTAYPLAALEDYFCVPPDYSETPVLTAQEKRLPVCDGPAFQPLRNEMDAEARQIQNVHRHFPIEVLHWKHKTFFRDLPHFYTLYKVAEGGFFIVYWEFAEGEITPKTAKINVYKAEHLYSNLTWVDFNTIEEGHSTLADVLAIDKKISGHGLGTTSRLADGSIVNIEYVFDGEAYANGGKPVDAAAYMQYYTVTKIHLNSEGYGGLTKADIETVTTQNLR